MKVLFVHEGYICDIKGSYYSVAYNNDIVNRYKVLGNEITFLTRKTSYTEINDKNHIDTNNFRFVGVENFMNTSGIKNYINARRIVKEEVLASDYVIARIPGILGSLAIKYSKKYSKKYIVELVGCPWDAFYNYSLKGKFIAPCMYLKTRIDVYRSNYVMYVSRNFLQNRYPTKGYSVGCPDVVLEEPKVEILEKRLKKIENRNNTLILGLIGSLDVDYRGHKTLLKAIVELNKRGIKCKAKFLGSGSNKRWIKIANEYGIGNEVEFSGVLPSGKEVLKWIDDIDILTMPTEAETLGRAVIEAMSRGCPVIASIETALREQIGEDCLCKAKDFNELANIIEKMSNDVKYMKYCAQENFYRSFKYTNIQTNKIRERFYHKFKKRTGLKE
ncbi:glycosyltransferase [Clostridium perfringens]|uniref:glycosyltransferase n=1 Tax=Clostridium perfringens TaxID=1502 RepID=UPI002ACC2B65|nr:glycosyltransferase [Clostridium perfringens]